MTRSCSQGEGRSWYPPGSCYLSPGSRYLSPETSSGWWQRLFSPRPVPLEPVNRCTWGRDSPRRERGGEGQTQRPRGAGESSGLGPPLWRWPGERGGGSGEGLRALPPSPHRRRRRRKGGRRRRREVRHGGSAPAPEAADSNGGGCAGLGGSGLRRRRRRMKRAAPRSTLRRIIKTHKPQLRLATNVDLLVRKQKGGRRALRPGVGCGPAPPARPSGPSAPAASSLPSAGTGGGRPAVLCRWGRAASSRGESSSSRRAPPGSWRRAGGGGAFGGGGRLQAGWLPGGGGGCPWTGTCGLTNVLSLERRGRGGLCALEHVGVAAE